MDAHIRIASWSANRPVAAVEEFLARPAFDPAAEKAAATVLADIRARGNAAVIEAAKRFDAADLAAESLNVSPETLAAAEAAVSPKVRRAVEQACEQVRRFSEAALRPDWSMDTPHGGKMGERFLPMDRVGVYVPGGTAPLASTAIMTVVLAKAAGVREIVACSPSREGRDVDAALLFALKLAGATEVYRVGGIQSIGLMAFGTETVRPVQLIAGPGNAYVTAAKRQVYGFTAIDQVAGPSEIAVLADDSANPEWVAADLLSQAEHGSGHEKSLLVTTSAALAEGVKAAVLRQIPHRSRRAIIERMIAAGGMLFAVVPDMDAGVALCNRFAAEHLELHVDAPSAILQRITAAGAVFVGPWTPESAGDFVAGPSHVLPTGGAAKMFSGLTPDTFRRRSSFVAFTREDLAATREAIETFGELEGLDAHGYAATVRFER